MTITQEDQMREGIRRRWLTKHLTFGVPAALDTLSRCLKQPCDSQELAIAKQVVLTWLNFDKACTTHRMVEVMEEQRTCRV